MTNNQLLPARVRAVFSILALPFALFAIAPRVVAQANPNPPERLAYQGFLVDANGLALATNAPKNYDVIFRIWNDPTAAAVGNRLWTEQQTVTVDKGYFSVILGEGSSIGEARPALSAVFTNSTASDRWIGLTVKGIGTGGSDANILPRLRLITSPYAFLATKAVSVDGAGVTSGTVADTRLSTNVALRAGGNTFSGNQIINNSLGIGISPSRPLTINGTGNNGISLINTTPSTGRAFAITTVDSGQFLIKDDITGSLQFWMDKPNSAFYLMGGNVGIGTNSPQSKLQVSGGNLQLDNGSQLLFTDNGEIRSSDGNHRILFRRSENKIELREYGDLIFSSGATAGAETAKAVMLANGNMGVGATNPAAKLQVAGSGFFGSDSGGLASSAGAGVRLFYEAASGGGQIFAYNYGASAATNLILQSPGGNVGIGTGSPQAKLHVAGAGNFLGSTPYIKFSDERPKGTPGGTANAGLNLRVFNTEYDPKNLGSLVGTNSFSLPAGTWQCRISAPAYRVNQHQARLRVVGSTNLLWGTSEFADSGTIVTTHSLIEGQFTIGSTSTLAVEHFVTSGNGVNGFGAFVNASWTDANAVEVYSVAEFWKIQ